LANYRRQRSGANGDIVVIKIAPLDFKFNVGINIIHYFVTFHGKIVNVQVVADLDVGVVEVERPIVANALVEQKAYVQMEWVTVQVQTLSEDLSPRERWHYSMEGIKRQGVQINTIHNAMKCSQQTADRPFCHPQGQDAGVGYYSSSQGPRMTPPAPKLLLATTNPGKLEELYDLFRGEGVALARAPYVAFLDSDDLFLPTKLEKQIRLFHRDPQLGFVHCSFSKFDDQGQDLGVRDASRFKGRIYPGLLQEWSVLMAMPCMLMRTEAIKEAGGFDKGRPWPKDPSDHIF